MNNIEDYFTSTEAAKAVGINVKNAVRFFERNCVPFQEIAGQRAYLKTDIFEFKAQRESGQSFEEKVRIAALTKPENRTLEQVRLLAVRAKAERKRQTARLIEFAKIRGVTT